MNEDFNLDSIHDKNNYYYFEIEEDLKKYKFKYVKDKKDIFEFIE